MRRLFAFMAGAYAVITVVQLFRGEWLWVFIDFGIFIGFAWSALNRKVAA